MEGVIKADIPLTPPSYQFQKEEKEKEEEEESFNCERFSTAIKFSFEL